MLVTLGTWTHGKFEGEKGLEGQIFVLQESLRINWNFQSEEMWGGSSQKLFSVL